MRGNSNPRCEAKLTVEACWKLSIQDLQQWDGEDMLRDDLLRAVFTLKWSERLAVRVTLEVPSPDRRILSIDDAGSKPKPFIGQSTLLVATAPNYGGRRWWFQCCDCMRRAMKLYLPPSDYHRWFACRRCHELVYASQQENHRPSRMWCRCAGVAGVDPYESFRALRARWREERRGRRYAGSRRL